jgi:hypothetical protein
MKVAIDLPHQVAYLDDIDIDIPTYSRGKALVMEGRRSSVKPKHYRLFWYTNEVTRSFRDRKERYIDRNKR